MCTNCACLQSNTHPPEQSSMPHFVFPLEALHGAHESCEVRSLSSGTANRLISHVFPHRVPNALLMHTGPLTTIANNGGQHVHKQRVVCRRETTHVHHITFAVTLPLTFLPRRYRGIHGSHHGQLVWPQACPPNHEASIIVAPVGEVICTVNIQTQLECQARITSHGVWALVGR